jgi:hypothetical protein
VRSFREDQRIPRVSTRVASSEGREPIQDVYCHKKWVIGDVLLQEDVKEFPVAYMSQCLLDDETQYVFMEKLCLSL